MNLTSEVLNVSTTEDGSQLGTRALWAEQRLNGDGRHDDLWDLMQRRIKCEEMRTERLLTTWMKGSSQKDVQKGEGAHSFIGEVVPAQGQSEVAAMRRDSAVYRRRVPVDSL